MTEEKMTSYGWVFFDALPEVESNGPDADNRSKKPLHNILTLPRLGRISRASASVGLQCKLLAEIHHQKGRLTMSALCLPKRWRVSDSIQRLTIL
jgi:hypothetical protein